MGWHFVPGLVASSSDSTSPSASSTAPWCTSSGMPTRRPPSWRGWKTRPWIQRLWPTILNPSTAERGVEQWISSLRDSRVSPLPPPANGSAPRTSDGSGRRSPGSFATSSPELSLSKMSRDSSPSPESLCAYAAGLIDGEGCIAISASKRYYTLTVVVGMTSKALPAMNMMFRRWGGSVRPRRASTERWADAWCWTICADSAVIFLQEIQPFLVLKQEQAQIALDFMALPSPRNSSNHRMAYERMAELNRKGPTKTLPEGAAAICVGGRWWGPQTSLFSKTGWEPFSGPWATSGSIRNGVYFPRPRSARRTSASGSSSWPSPDTGLSPEGHGRRGGSRKNGHQSGEDLKAAAALWQRMWPTPTATPYGSSQNGINGIGGENERPSANTPSLERKARNWPTPTLGDSKASGHRQDTRTPTSHDGTTLSDAIQKLWPTPRTITGGAESAERKQELGRTESGGGDLQAAAEMWPTPAARDWRGENGPAHLAKTRGHHDQLPNFLASRLVPTTMPDGAPSSSERRTLNPLFVEALMGWPENWSSASIDSGCSATAWSRWWRRMRSALSRLG